MKLQRKRIQMFEVNILETYNKNLRKLLKLKKAGAYNFLRFFAAFPKSRNYHRWETSVVDIENMNGLEYF